MRTNPNESLSYARACEKVATDIELDVSFCQVLWFPPLSTDKSQFSLKMAEKVTIIAIYKFIMESIMF